MKTLIALYLVLLIGDIAVWAITAWKCWRIGGTPDVQMFWRALAGHFLSLAACFTLSLIGAIMSPPRPPPEMFGALLTLSGVALLSCASWAFLLYITGRGK